MESLASAEQIYSRLRDIKSIATLPQVMTRIMAVVTDGKSSAKDLAKEIRTDQALTSKILKISNSAYYGFYRKIVNIEDAVVVLGFKEIRSLALAVTVYGLFDEGKNVFFNRKYFWRHCVITAVLSEMLSEPYPEQQAQAFTAGLLHDLGRAILDQYFPEEWKVICREVEQRRQHWLPVERELIGTDHGEIGYWVAERWSFPQGLTECMRFHHEPLRAEVSPRLTAIVHLADLLSRRDAQEQAQCEALPQLDPGVYKQVPLSRNKVEALAGNYQTRKAGVEALIGQLTTA